MARAVKETVSGELGKPEEGEKKGNSQVILGHLEKCRLLQRTVEGCSG